MGMSWPMLYTQMYVAAAAQWGNLIGKPHKAAAEEKLSQVLQLQVADDFVIPLEFKLFSFSSLKSRKDLV